MGLPKGPVGKKRKSNWVRGKKLMVVLNAQKEEEGVLNLAINRIVEIL